MIVLVGDNNINELRVFTDRADIYACRIACLLDSYGIKYDFARFWLQYSENGKPVSAIAKYYSDITVSLTESSDITELAALINCIGCESISSSKPIILSTYHECGVVMKLDRSRLSKAEAPKAVQLTEAPDLSEVYNILKSCRESGFDVPAYKDFILDMSHKIRHSTAMCSAARFNGELAACAMTVAQSKCCAVIGAVAVKKQYRRLGLGSLCINDLCLRLGNRDVFIVRQRSKNREFYLKAGFE